MEDGTVPGSLGVVRESGPSAASGVLVRLATTARDVGRLVLPVECPGCGRVDEVLCPSCAALLAGPPARCEAAVPRLDRMDGAAPPPVWAVVPYAGPVRGVVVAWKDRGRADLTGTLVAAMARAGRRLGPALHEVAARGGPALVPVLALVPVPTTPAARRRRGADLVRLLAEGLSRGLGEAGVGAEVVPALRRRPDPWRRDQVGLGARSRARNVAGSVVVRGGRQLRRVVVLVDDVVTTGSTLAACRAALEAAGALVVGAVVLAATPSPSGTGGPGPTGAPGWGVPTR